MLRKAALAGLTAIVLAVSAAPAFAGPAETAFLAKLTNNWVGKGKLTGAQTGPIACRVVLTGGGQSIKYQGRCNIPDMASQAFNGAIIYNDKLQRYETRTLAGVVAGVRRGDKLVFTTTSKSIAGSSYSTMTISATSFTVDFAIVDGKTGDKTTSHISFTK